MIKSQYTPNFIVASFILVDLLFLPRIVPLFGIPVSLFLVLAIIVKTGISRNQGVLLSLLILTGLISIINGATFKYLELTINDVKRLAQVCTSLLYGAIFIRLTNSEWVGIRLIFRVFVGWVFAMSIIFLTMPGLYLSLTNLIFPEAADSIDANIEAMRFNYFFQDPNTAGYFVCFALCVYVVLERNTVLLAISLLLAAFTITVTQSRGAMGGFVLIVLYLALRENVSRSARLMIGTFFVLAFYLLANLYGELLETAIEMYEFRTEAEEALDLGFGGGRIFKYEYFFANMNFWPFGVGYSLAIDGNEFRPHSDLIRINLSYGYLFLVFISFFIYPKNRSVLLLFIVFTIPFLINSVIDDYKLFPLYLFASMLLQSATEQSNAKLS